MIVVWVLAGMNTTSIGRLLASIEHRVKEQTKTVLSCLFCSEMLAGIQVLADTKYESIIASFCEDHKHISRFRSLDVDVLLVSSKW